MGRGRQAICDNRETERYSFPNPQLNEKRQDTGTHGEDTEGDEDKERQKDVVDRNKQKIPYKRVREAKNYM